MRVCILSDELITDFNPAPFMDGYDWEMVTMTSPVMDVLRALEARQEFDVYLNLCEGYEDDEEEPGYQGIEVVQGLEVLNLPYTGADSKFFDPSREEMKAAAERHGLSFVQGYRVESVEEAERLLAKLRFPIMVKHPKGYGSTGMTKAARADTLAQVRAQVTGMCCEFGAARMEEFIVGTEFNVLVVDNPDDFSKPIAYPPAQLIFPPGEEFWHVDIKWKYDVPFEFKQVTDPQLIARLHALAIGLYRAMNGSGYGRCDMRMNERGELFLLEINPNAGIMYLPNEYGPADYMILYDSEGYQGFFDRIFRTAIMRQKLRAG